MSRDYLCRRGRLRETSAMRDVERMLMPSTRHLIMSAFVFAGSVFIMNIILANNIICKHYVQFILGILLKICRAVIAALCVFGRCGYPQPGPSRSKTIWIAPAGAMRYFCLYSLPCSVQVFSVLKVSSTSSRRMTCFPPGFT